jgi:invasion protein IalB
MMNKRRMEQWLPPLTLSVAMLSVLLMSHLSGAQQAAPPGDAAEKAGEPEMASRGQRKTVREIKYGDWQKFCFKTPGTNMVCRTTISGTFDTGQSAVRADLIEREGDSKARLQLFLPVGLYLQTPVKLTVDQGKPYQVPYVWCMTNTCIAGNPANPELIRDMEKGRKLMLEIVDSSVQSVSTELPLDQFAAVRKGAPAKTFLQEIDE